MKLNSSLLIMAIIALAFLMPATAGAEVHTVQIMDDENQPRENIWVTFTINTEPLVWEDFQDETDASGNATVNVVRDPGAQTWRWHADDNLANAPNIYTGPDDNPGERPYPEVTTLLNEDEDGWR
ncbi:hypothetical protein ACFLQV_03120 [Calditrichota bacterium]